MSCFTAALEQIVVEQIPYVVLIYIVYAIMKLNILSINEPLLPYICEVSIFFYVMSG